MDVSSGWLRQARPNLRRQVPDKFRFKRKLEPDSDRSISGSQPIWASNRMPDKSSQSQDGIMSASSKDLPQQLRVPQISARPPALVHRCQFEQKSGNYWQYKIKLLSFILIVTFVIAISIVHIGGPFLKNSATSRPFGLLRADDGGDPLGGEPTTDASQDYKYPFRYNLIVGNQSESRETLIRARRNAQQLDDQKIKDATSQPPVDKQTEPSSYANKTMVIVSNKSGSFNQLVALDDLIVTPATPEVAATNLGDLDPLSGSPSSLAELTGAATAAGIIIGDSLANVIDNQGNPAETANSMASSDEPPTEAETLTDADKEHETDSIDPPPTVLIEEQPLARNIQPSMGAQNLVNLLARPAPQVDASDEDGDDYDGETGSIVPELRRPIYQGHPSAGLVANLGPQHHLGVHGATMKDLHAAAGHHYGKKKKKKKKKKIIIIKKSKKKKKYKKKKKVIKKKIIIKKKKYKKKKHKKPMKKKKKKHHGHHHHDHGKYYMYAKVPKKKSWEFGYKKGNKKHWIERHEKGHKNKFKTKVKWFDKKSKGKGVHIWDYNHHDKKKKKHY